MPQLLALVFFTALAGVSWLANLTQMHAFAFGACLGLTIAAAVIIRIVQ